MVGVQLERGPWRWRLHQNRWLQKAVNIVYARQQFSPSKGEHMVAKTAKTVKVVRSAKTVRQVKPAGRTAGGGKPVPSFPRQQQKLVDPWQTPIAKDFAPPRLQQRTPQHTKPGGAALTIQRGGGAATKVTKLAVREDRVAKKRGVVEPPKKTTKKDSGRPLKFNRDDSLKLTPKSIKALAQLVKLQLEGKPITKRKQYPTRSSTIVRVPNEILDLVKQQIAAYRRKKAESK
jgi:hypothetical protein